MTRKLALAAALFAAALVAAPSIAGAHVEVTADSPPGADGLVAAKVFSENECKQQLKTVELLFPSTPELTVATPSPVAGWTSAVATKPGTQTVASITWTNDGSATGDGSFPLGISPVPAGETSVKFKAIDTCDDGQVFRWIQDGETSEFPAPVLRVTQTADARPDTTTETKVKVTTTKKSDNSSTGIVIGVVAASLVLIGAGVVMFRRSKK